MSTAHIMTSMDLDPESRASEPGETKGVPVTLCGKQWLLAHGGIGNTLDAIRDEIYDHSRMYQTVPMNHVIDAAVVLLMANYDLDLLEAARLLMEPESQQHLADAVAEALFGASGDLTYTEWALASMYVAGIDPSKVLPEHIPVVLDLLVMTGRTIPPDKITGAGKAAGQWNYLRGIAEEQKAKRAEAEAEKAAPVEITTTDAAESREAQSNA